IVSCLSLPPVKRGFCIGNSKDLDHTANKNNTENSQNDGRTPVDGIKKGSHPFPQSAHKSLFSLIVFNFQTNRFRVASMAFIPAQQEKKRPEHDHGPSSCTTFMRDSSINSRSSPTRGMEQK